MRPAPYKHTNTHASWWYWHRTMFLRASITRSKKSIVGKNKRKRELYCAGFWKRKDVELRKRDMLRAMKVEVSKGDRFAVIENEYITIHMRKK